MESLRRCRPGALTRPRWRIERAIVAAGERKAASGSRLLLKRESPRTRTSALIRSRRNTGGGEQWAHVPTFQMPCFGRVYRSGNELTDGSLGTIFIFRSDGHREKEICIGPSWRTQSCVPIVLSTPPQPDVSRKIGRVPTAGPLPPALFSTTFFPGTDGSSRNCSGTARTDKAWRRLVIEDASRTVGYSTVRSTCSNPADSSGGSGRISKPHPPKHSSPSAPGIAGSAKDKFPRSLCKFP